MAELWLYWQDHPPVHISVGALLRAWGGKPGKAPPRAVAARSAPVPGTGSPAPMEAVAALLGPPRHKFRPPCRMVPPRDGLAPP